MTGKTGLLRVMKSVLASAFGVQSYKNYQHDFSQSSVKVYLLVGVAFVVLLVLLLVALVHWITP